MEPLYRQVADALERRINEGEVQPGERLTSYRAIEEEHGVSDSTAHEVVDVLVARGLVLVQPKRGIFVRGPQPRQRLVITGTLRRNDLGYLFTDPSGHWVPLGSPTRGQVACSEEIATELRVEQGTPVVARRRVVGLSPREPMLLTTTYLHPGLVEQVPQVTEADTGPGGWLDRAEEQHGGPVAVVSSYYWRRPLPDEAESLWMPTTLHALIEVRRIFPHGVDVEVDPPLAVDLVVRDAARWEIRLELTRDGSAAWPVAPASSRNAPAAGP